MKKSLLFPILLLLLYCSSDKTNDGTENTSAQELVEEVSHYEHGVIKTQGNLSKGKREGLWISNFQDGKRWSESVYKNGLLHGTTTVFYPTGVMFYKGKFRENKRVSEWIFYTEEGKIDYKKKYPD